MDNLFQAWAANYWVSLGAPKSKLVIGMGTYGRGNRLAGPANGVGAPTSGASDKQPFTREIGIASYYEVFIYMYFIFNV